MKRHRRSLRTATAMTDIAFLLLLFFIILSIVSLRTPIQPPVEISGAPGTEEKEIRLYIDRNGTLQFRERPTVIEEFIQVVKEASVNPVIGADEQTPYRFIAPVMNALQEHGIESVGFLVETKGGSQ